jgi:excisionase family DNA binding protein
MVQPRLLKIPEVAEILMVGVSRCYEMARTGEIPAFRLGRRWRVPTEQFYDWMNTQAREGLTNENNEC